MTFMTVKVCLLIHCFLFSFSKKKFFAGDNLGEEISLKEEKDQKNCLYLKGSENKKTLEEDKEVEVPYIFGYWTTENAELILDDFMQTNKTHADYKYIQNGGQFSRFV